MLLTGVMHHSTWWFNEWHVPAGKAMRVASGIPAAGIVSSCQPCVPRKMMKAKGARKFRGTLVCTLLTLADGF